MHFSTLFFSIAMMSTTGWARYTLQDDYMADGNFFDKFAFFNAPDPTDGFVSYQDQGSAQKLGLVNGSSSQVYIGVDYQNQAPSGRPSIRLTSNSVYQSGLVIVDLEHMPGGICGTWPAFWMVGPDWPSQGEIDIIEGVNDQTCNKLTLHTGPGCSISNTKSFTGQISSSNCDINAAGQEANEGCGIESSDQNSYGTGFNNNKGGVYATEWTDSAISIYFFPRGNIPSDIANGSPDPSSWGQPMALFSGGCNFGSTFTNQQIVFDTTFCGQWAGQVWDGSSCASRTGATCEDYVANNPQAFAEAYWTVNGLKVYQNNGASSPAPSNAPAPGPSSAAPSAPYSSGWGSGGQSSFHTVSTPAYSQPAPTAAPPAPSGGYPAPSSAAPAPVPGPSNVPEVSGTPSWPAPSGGGHHGHPHHSWGGSPPWQSGGWAEYDNGEGAYAVGTPAGKHRARHLNRHKRHHAGRL